MPSRHTIDIGKDNSAAFHRLIERGAVVQFSFTHKEAYRLGLDLIERRIEQHEEEYWKEFSKRLENSAAE